MANNAVRLPLYYFPDPTKGRPVFNGSVFIGNPDTDPEVLGNRKSVTLVEENGTEIPIAGAGQPFLTGTGGVILYNGSPVQALTDGNYSIKVLNAQGSQVYYVPRVGESPATIDKVVLKFDTLADAIASSEIYDTAALNIAEHTAGNGGGAMWDAVLSSTVTENTFNIVQCTGVPTLSLVIRIEDATLNISEIGALLAGDIFATLEHAISLDEVAIIKLPRSSALTLSSTILIDKALRIDGAGSCSAKEGNSTGAPGTSTTRITYTGTSDGIRLIGSGTEGVENIHLSNFSLWGSVSANDGIQVGTATLVTKSSFKNLHVRGFTKSGKFGIRLSRCLEFFMENVYTQFNDLGWGNLDGDVCTTLRTKNVHSRTNTVNGVLIQGTFSGGDCSSVLCEGNGEEGMVIAPGPSASCTGNAFYAYYSEANNAPGAGTATGIAPIAIGNSTGVASDITFYGAKIDDDATGDFGGKSVDLNRADNIVFSECEFTTYNPNFIECTTNTSGCVFRTAIKSIKETDITGNGVFFGNPRVTVEGGAAKIAVGTITRNLADADGSIVESGLGFLPRAITFFAAVDNTSMMSMGMSDGSAQLSVHDTTSFNPGTFGIAAGAVILRGGAGILATGSITIDTLGQFTIDWIKTGLPTGTAKIYYTVHG